MPWRSMAELLKRTDNPDHGSEEADEGGVVAERTEIRQPAFEAATLEGGGALHCLVGSRWPTIGELQTGRRDCRRHGPGLAEFLDRPLEVATRETSPELSGHCLKIALPRPVEEPSLYDDGDTHERQRSQEPENPGRSGLEQDLFDGVDGVHDV